MKKKIIIFLIIILVIILGMFGLYFYELTHREDLTTPIYNFYEEKLHNIDSMSSHHLSITFPLNRDRLFGLVIGRLEFGYEFDGTNASVEYYVNRDPQNDWFDWLIETRNRQDRIIKEVINDYLKKNVL